MQYISDETRKKQHRGTGTGAEYKPWIKPREIPSLGTCVSLIDWKSGRIVQLLSQGEAMWYYHLRWDDSVADINEQYPLDVDQTWEIAQSMGIKHPQDRGVPYVMTTDLLVTRVNGAQEAYSIKADRSLSQRTMEKEAIQKAYWLSHGIPFYLVTKAELNRNEMLNLQSVLAFYDAKWVRPGNEFDLIKYMISHKKISVDLTAECIDYRALIDKYLRNKGGNL